MKRLKDYLIIGFAVLFLSLILFSSCDEYKSEEFEIAQIDEEACTALMDTLADTLNVLSVGNYAQTLADSNFYKEFDWSYLDTVGLTGDEKQELRAAWEDSVDNVVEAAAALYDSVFVNQISGAEFTEFYNMLVDSMESKQLIVDEAGTKYRLENTADEFYHTVLFNTTFSSIVIFSDKSLSFDFIDANGNTTTYTNVDMPTTTVSGCQVAIDPDAASPLYKALIQTRLEIPVSSAGTNTVMRIIEHENTEGGAINMTFVENN